MKKGIIVLVLIILALGLYGCNMDNLPKGELKNTVYSENKEYAINIYLCSGNATTDFSIRGEFENISTGEKRNIYWKYHCEEAEVKWISEDTVVINDVELNVFEDEYDWRDE